jgi:preprotein translocase subunit SecY
VDIFQQKPKHTKKKERKKKKETRKVFILTILTDCFLGIPVPVYKNAQNERKKQSFFIFHSLSLFFGKF